MQRMFVALAMALALWIAVPALAVGEHQHRIARRVRRPAQGPGTGQGPGDHRLSQGQWPVQVGRRPEARQGHRRQAPGKIASRTHHRPGAQGCCGRCEDGRQGRGSGGQGRDPTRRRCCKKVVGPSPQVPGDHGCRDGHDAAIPAPPCLLPCPRHRGQPLMGVARLCFAARFFPGAGCNHHRLQGSFNETIFARACAARHVEHRLRGCQRQLGNLGTTRGVARASARSRPRPSSTIARRMARSSRSTT